MKKYILLCMIMLFIVGCSDWPLEVDNRSVSDAVDNTIQVEPVYVDENPVIVGLYQNGKLINNLNTQINPNNDIAVFDVYFTNVENTNDTNTKRNFNKYASNYEDINKYKIGFIINFTAEGKTINEVITSPKDMYVASPYIYNYLYDDVHQSDGSWYSHVTEDDVNEDTIYSSIKLYATKYVDTITSPINLTVFTYDTEDDFDENGMYRGNSKYTIAIMK